MANPNIGQLSSMYFYAWKKGLKTTYYLRSRPATRITQTTVDVAHKELGTGNKEQATAMHEAPARKPQGSAEAGNAHHGDPLSPWERASAPNAPVTPSL